MKKAFLGLSGLMAGLLSSSGLNLPGMFDLPPILSEPAYGGQRRSRGLGKNFVATRQVHDIAYHRQPNGSLKEVPIFRAVFVPRGKDYRNAGRRR